MRFAHHIILVMLFLLLFMSGYHSFLGYFLFITTLPMVCICTDMWVDVVRTRETPQVHPLVERIEMTASRPLIERD